MKSLNGNKFALVIAGIFFITFLLLITLPIIAVFLRFNLSDAWSELQSPTVLSALAISFLSSTAASVISLGLTVPTAYILARRSFRGKKFLDTLIDLPIVLPPAVAGVALLWTFAPRGLLGSLLNNLGIILPGSIFAVIIAQVFVASPFLMRSAKNAFQNIDTDIINSAKILTSSRLRIFFTITLPLSKRQILSGLAMTWARAMGEFGATMMFAGNLPGVTQTMPLAIYTLMAADPFGAVVLSVILIVFAYSILIVIKYLEHENNRSKP